MVFSCVLASMSGSAGCIPALYRKRRHGFLSGFSRISGDALTVRALCFRLQAGFSGRGRSGKELLSKAVLNCCAGRAWPEDLRRVSGTFPAEHDQLSGKLQFPDNMPVLTAENTVCLGQIRAVHKVKNILRMKMYPKVVIDASAAGLVEHILIGINNL